MANPQFKSEASADQGGTSSATLLMPTSFAANDVIIIIVATDGYVPTMSTPNGFAIATDPNGNAASITTNGGTPGTAECGLFAFYKRAVGGDSAPVLAAPTNGGTAWCCEANAYSGCRTTGTPFHIIATQVISTATTSIAPPAVTPTLNACTILPVAASAEDDQAFNSWTVPGAASPPGDIDTGWHNPSGNKCSFVGGIGGFATAGGARSGTSSFASATKQAQFTLVLASLAEVAAATGNEAANAGPSTAGSSGGVAVTGSVSATLGPSSAGSSGAVAIAGSGSAQLDASTAAITGSTITRTGTTAQTLGASLASSSGTITGGPTGNEQGSLAGSAGTAAGTVSVGGSESATLAGSSAVAGGAVPVAGNASGINSSSIAAAAGSVFTPSTLALGAVAFRQKANEAGATTGTLTTLPVYPAWTQNTTYQLVNAVRVTNLGACYELAQGGTSASSGTGPNATGNGIVDGSCRWNRLDVGTGACNTQASGSFFIATVGRGRDATSGTPPRDNKGNTYTLINKTFYASFPTSAAAVYSAGVGTGGAGHTLSADWGAGTSAGGDEITEVIAEFPGGARIQDHSSSEVSPVANVCTSLPVVTTGPAILIAFLWLNGGVQADGFLHTATPGSGWTALPLASGLMEIANGAGQVQMATMFKPVTVPGSYAATFTTANGEGAIVHLLAIQGPAGINGNEAAAASGSTSSSSGTVTTPRTGSGAAALGASSAATVGGVAITGNGASVSSSDIAAAAGVVAITGTATSSAGGSTAASSGTLVPILAGNEAAQAGASTAASFGTVFTGHAGNVGVGLDGSRIAAAGGVAVTGSAALQARASVASSTGQVQVTGSGAASLNDSRITARATSGLAGGAIPRLSGALATNGQLTGVLQLQGVTVANIDGPIVVYQGDTASYMLTVTDDTGAPYDLTFATAIEVRVKPSDGAPDPPTILLSLGAGVTLLDQVASKGKAAVNMSSTDTTVAPRAYRLDVVVVAPGLRQHVIAPRDFMIAAVV